jgi:hypothetical protein
VRRRQVSPLVRGMRTLGYILAAFVGLSLYFAIVSTARQDGGGAAFAAFLVLVALPASAFFGIRSAIRRRRRSAQEAHEAAGAYATEIALRVLVVHIVKKTWTTRFIGRVPVQLFYKREGGDAVYPRAIALALKATGNFKSDAVPGLSVGAPGRQGSVGGHALAGPADLRDGVPSMTGRAAPGRFESGRSGP